MSEHGAAGSARADRGAETAPWSVARLVAAVIDRLEVDPVGRYGVAHWARTMENGLRIASRTGANVRVVQAFAVLHDAAREHEGEDEGHGERAAMLAASLPATILPLTNEELALLVEACEHHEQRHLHGDPTVVTCWDADRLDVARTGVPLAVGRLCTAVARESGIRGRANDRALEDHWPSVIEEEWGIDRRDERFDGED